MRCRGLLRLANTAFLGSFLCSGLLRVAPYCAPGGIRVVSGEVKSWWITRRRFLCKPDVAGTMESAESTSREQPRLRASRVHRYPTELVSDGL
jgi:hypothetical protein